VVQRDPVGVTRAALLRARRRVGFEVFAVPRRGLRLLHYLWRGIIGHRDSKGYLVGGWLGLVMWCLALREREDARHIADDKPGKQLSATSHADHLAIWHSAVVLAPNLLLVWASGYYVGRWWLGLIPIVIITMIYGWKIDPRPPAPLDPYKPGDVTVEAINSGLRAVGLLEKPTVNRPAPDGVRLVRLPRVVGPGQELTFDLPASVKASAMDVIAQRERLAASLAIPKPQLVLEPGEHPGRVVLWHAKHDPFSTAPIEHPLLDAERWNIFDPIPFGTDARGRRISAPIVSTHWLVGAVPRAGKTSAARVVSAGAVLDPHCDIHVFDGKMGKDWSALDGIAETYDAGPIHEQARNLSDLLDALLAEGDRRFQHMRTLPDELCPDSQITPEIVQAGMPFVWLVIDEAHKHLGDERYGAQITHKLIQYVKGYPACGLGLLVCTQDAEGGIAERFTALRRVIGTRFALRVMDYRAADMILGEQVRAQGLAAQEILPHQKGTGILRGDLDADGKIDKLAQMLRTYHLDNRAWRAICEVGRELRRDRYAQTTPDDKPEEEPDEMLTATELLERIRLYAPEALPDAVEHPRAVGEWLSSRGVRAERTTAGQRVRSRLSVEMSLGLPSGCLTAATGPSPDPASDGAVAGARQGSDNLSEG
jgi:hypothetical protein